MLSNIYRPPEKYVAELDSLQNFHNFYIYDAYNLTLLQHRIRTSFICGDFNVNLLEISTNAHFNNYFESIISKGFFPRITLPTRIQPPSFSLIDNILCNDIGGTVDSTSGLLINDISDHKMIFTHFPNDSYKNKVNKFIVMEKNNEASINNFCEYYDHIFSLYKNDIKNTWKILNETLNRNRRKHQSQDFLNNNKLVNDPDIIVNEFNAFFVNIAKNLADSIPVADHFSTYLNDPSDNTFKFDLVTERDVAYIIHNFKNKKSYGHNYLSNILLKRAQATLVKPLTFLINQTVYFQEN